MFTFLYICKEPNKQKIMNYREFNKDYKMRDLKIIANLYESDGIPDKPARREAYNNKLDDYERNGLITSKQAYTWCIPDSYEKTKFWL